MADIIEVNIDSSIIDGLRRKDHVIFFLNREGVHPDEKVGYSLVNQIADEKGMTQYKDVGRHDFGEVISHYDEGSYVWYHGVVCHSITDGWPEPEGLWSEDIEDPQCAYGAIRIALEKIWDEFADESVRAFRTIWPATGKMRQLGSHKGDVKKGLAALAAGPDLMPLAIHLYP